MPIPARKRSDTQSELTRNEEKIRIIYNNNTKNNY